AGPRGAGPAPGSPAGRASSTGTAPTGRPPSSAATTDGPCSPAAARRRWPTPGGAASCRSSAWGPTSGWSWSPRRAEPTPQRRRAEADRLFTGIVEELGRVEERDGGRFRFAGSVVTEDAKAGDSIAVNGCCLTVTDVAAGSFVAEAVPETLARTNL